MSLVVKQFKPIMQHTLKLSKKNYLLTTIGTDQWIDKIEKISLIENFYWKFFFTNECSDIICKSLLNIYNNQIMPLVMMISTNIFNIF